MDASNMWSFLTTLVTGLIGLATTFLLWWTSKQNTKLQQMSDTQQAMSSTQRDIHVLVNGNLHREQEENKRLRALLEQHGIDSDSGQTNNS
jgi:enterochelin esterase-like enzyme